jgi:succinoglycan biosynthesis protein ExoL
MKIVFLLPNISNARCLKRIEALERLGIHVVLLGFTRGYFPGKEWHGDYKILGDIEEGAYPKRLIVFLLAFIKVVKEIKSANVVYAFGQDLLGLGWLASFFIVKKPGIVCEVSDIQPALTGNNMYSRVLRFIERFLMHNINLLVVTSYAFISEYYIKIQGLTAIPFQVIENKVDSNHILLGKNKGEEFSIDGKLRIGYFGLLRSHQSWEILKLVAKRGCGRIKIFMRGSLSNKVIEEEVNNIPNIEYGGPYISPDELTDIYSRVDMVWDSYYEGPDIGNWCWQRTNRFYEACFFGKPLFCHNETEDGRIVTTLELGLSSDMTRQEDYVDLILGIEASQIEIWKKNIAKLPADKYTYTNEHVILANALCHM